LVVMIPERPWMWSLFSKEEIDELITNSSRIMWDQENGLIVNLTLTNNQCMDFLHHYHLTRDLDLHDSYDSIAFIEEFLLNFAVYIQEYLDEEAPGWQERFYGVPTDDEED